MATSLIDINFENGSLLNKYNNFLKSPFASTTPPSPFSTETSLSTAKKPVSNEPYILNIESTAEYHVNQYKESYENYLELSKGIINKETRQVTVDKIPTKPKIDRWGRIKESLQEKAESRNLGRVGEKIRFRREVQQEQIWRKQHEVWANFRENWVGELLKQGEIAEIAGENRGSEAKRRQKLIKKLSKNWKKVEWEDVRKTKYGEVDLHWYNTLSSQNQFNVDYESPKKIRPEFSRSLWRSSQVFRLIETNFGKWSYEQAYKIILERENYFEKCWSEVKHDLDIDLLSHVWEKEQIQQQGQENKDTHDSLLRKLIKYLEKIYCVPWDEIPKDKFGEVDFEWYQSLTSLQRYRVEHETPSKIKPELVQSIWRHVEINRIRSNGGEHISLNRAYELALRRENELKSKWLKVRNNPICIQLSELWEREEELLRQTQKESSKKNIHPLPSKESTGSENTVIEHAQSSTTIAQESEKNTIDEKHQEFDSNFWSFKLFFKCALND
ncbi:14524_t:CDS:2 [Ambispora leptoticha]|uniref:14524_t:CDS:1 n=1 Tax=Ambispora leptoticha TaxID=144679 RepID=A0A9N8YQT6_9GLOM|nr:14524_t:CDS:2 [Ambispora leptoticha]